ncbi:MAG: insulinase family protein, partial [Deltaproteobacteria bacterium]|nr:insulinase family protein [Deltaproteobacteria bacterium]
LATIKSQEDNLPSYTFKLLYRTLYKTHPYGMPVIGTSDTVAGFKREDIIRHHEQFFAPDRLVLTIVGDVQTDYAVTRVKAALKDFTRPSTPLTPPIPEARQTDIRKTGAAKEKAQTHIGLGFLGVNIGSDDSYALKTLSEILAGQGGRLFVNLRDREGLAYSLSAFSREGVDPGLFGVYIGTAPDKKDAALSGIMRELASITALKVNDDELKRAKGSLIGGYTIGLQDVGSQASDMANNELYGLGYAFSKALPEKIQAVTADDVLRAGKKYITLDAYTISIVGPETDRENGK